MFYECESDLAATQAFVASRLRDRATTFYIAVVDEAPAGFMQLLPAFDTLGLMPAWILEDLFVAPAYRKRGVASALLAHAEHIGRAGGASRILLSTAHTNETAQRVYVAHGYEHDLVFRTYRRTLP